MEVIMAQSERVIPTSSIFNLDKEPASTKERGRKKRIAIRAAQITAGVAVAGAVLSGSNHDKNTETFENIGFTPQPAVSSSGTEALIGLNDTLREYGPYVLGLGVLAGGAYEIGRRRPDSRLSAMHDITHQTKRWPRIAFTGAVMGIVASASGLGDTASHGANEPVKAMAEMLGADAATTPIITGYDNTPYNTSVINFDDTQKVITEAGGTAIPFMQNLGEVKSPDAASNPSSSPVFAVPNEVLQKSLGVSMPELANCDDMSVIVGEQLGVSAGDAVTINDHPATVAGTVDMKPGLDRVAVIGSVEQIGQCIYPEQPMTGAVALGLDGKQAELQQKMEELGLTYSARSFEEFQEEYKEFWDRSVKPPEMNLILDSLLLGGIAIGAMQTTEVLRRRKNMAMLMSQGVEKKYIKRANKLAAQRDALLAVPVAAGTGVILTAATNSTQFGLEQAMNLSSLGAGYAAAAGVTGLSSFFASRVIKKTNVAQELRSME